MVENKEKVVDYGVFAGLFKQRNGEFPRPFVDEVRSKQILEVSGEVPEYLQLQYFLTFGNIWEGAWKEAIYHIPEVAQQLAYTKYDRFSGELPRIDVIPHESLRRGREIRRDIIGGFADERGRATVGLILPEPGRVMRVEFKHKPEYAGISLPQKSR